jgi:hypothetical protein
MYLGTPLVLRPLGLLHKNVAFAELKQLSTIDETAARSALSFISAARWRSGNVIESRTTWALLFLVVFPTIAIELGADATPDFRIYHYYNGYAAWTGRSGLDILPAQVQSFFFRGLDATYFLLFQTLNSYPRFLNAVLALPFVAGAWLIFLLGDSIVPKGWPWRRSIAAIAALYGLTGAASLPTIATTMSDTVPGLSVIAALCVWFLPIGRMDIVMRAGLSGLLCGLAVALKLTQTPLFAGFGLAILLMGSRRFGRNIVAAAWFGIAGVAIFLLIDGAWLLGNYASVGNPVFPAFNNVFKSDYFAHVAWSLTEYKPTGVVMALFFPAWWAFAPLVQTYPAQDPRMLVGLCSVVIIITAGVTRKLTRKHLNGVAESQLFLAVFFIAAYALWEYQFSIHRYLAILESLTGLVLIGALSCIGLRTRPAWAISIVLIVVGTTAAFTRYPPYSRAAAASQAHQFFVLPTIERDAMVMILDPYGFSYVVPALPPTVRVIGADTNLGGPGSGSKFQEAIEAAIRSHSGPLWGMEDPLDYRGVADAVLKYYNFSRTLECVDVKTNIEDRPRVRMCRLSKGENSDSGPPASAELFKAGVRQLYKELLGRDVDASGLKYWSDVAARSGSLDPVRAGIMASEEYRSKRK